MKNLPSMKIMLGIVRHLNGFVRVTSNQVQVIDKTQYCGIQTASLNNYYGHDDIRAGIP